jgi:Na+-driven multidrug efflux pump
MNKTIWQLLVIALIAVVAVIILAWVFPDLFGEWINENSVRHFITGK